MLLSRSLKAAMLKHASNITQAGRLYAANIKSCASYGSTASLSEISARVAAALGQNSSSHACRMVNTSTSARLFMNAQMKQAPTNPFPFGSFSTTGRTSHSGWHSSGRRLLSGRPSRAQQSRMLDEARRKRQRAKNLQVAMYMGGMTLFTISFTYASVPLYRIFCQKTGFAGTVKTEDVDYTERAKPVSGKRLLTIKFNADVSEGMPWKFIPQQPHVKVVPGEAALVFYKALNKTDKPIIGVASYNVQPEGAAAYFNKIQCFCFEEQMLGPNEKIDMPVFFFIDPDFLNDKNMDAVETITLSYTFWKSGDANAPDIATMLAEQERHKAVIYPRPEPVAS